MWLEDYLWCLTRIAEFLRSYLRPSAPIQASPLNEISEALVRCAQRLDALAVPAETALAAHYRANRISLRRQELKAAYEQLHHEQLVEETARDLMLYALWPEVKDRDFIDNAVRLLRTCLRTLQVDGADPGALEDFIVVEITPKRTVPPDKPGALAHLVIESVRGVVKDWLHSLLARDLDFFLRYLDDLARSLEETRTIEGRYNVAKEIAMMVYEALALSGQPGARELAQAAHHKIVPFVEPIA